METRSLLLVGLFLKKLTNRRQQAMANHSSQRITVGSSFLHQHKVTAYVRAHLSILSSSQYHAPQMQQTKKKQANLSKVLRSAYYGGVTPARRNQSRSDGQSEQSR